MPTADSPVHSPLLPPSQIAGTYVHVHAEVHELPKVYMSAIQYIYVLVYVTNAHDVLCINIQLIEAANVAPDSATESGKNQPRDLVISSLKLRANCTPKGKDYT